MPADPGPPHRGRLFIRICWECGYRKVQAAIGTGAAVETPK